ncbi:MmpS family transport accessory protein [Gordonia sp. CPCC 205333]|uniref:MmpS family transport accessory protein n=1 Tax=Gordonia sp. CPCC 205333 TaxID=3140790 RepID=UPI003AF402FE
MWPKGILPFEPSDGDDNSRRKAATVGPFASAGAIARAAVPSAAIYKVSGDGGKASITYTGADSNMAQDTVAALPWEKKVTLKGFMKIASLTATNDFEASDGSKSTCEILVSGKVKFTQTGTGPGATASCSGSVD